MEKITFVILHYLAIDDTIECINSIKNNIDYKNNYIVVVDNGSFNETGIQLEDKYKNDEKVKVIINKENLGFAQGNNVGYKYAKDVLKSDYIVVLNNDTVIEQKDFSDSIIEIFNEKKYHILGPDIISTRVKGHHQNPALIRNFSNKDDVAKHIKSLKISYIKCLIKKYTKTSKLVKKIKKVEEVKTDNYIDYDIENVKLHGACLIYSSLYILENDNAFNPKTFMYMEEDVLYFESKKKNYKMLYSPKVKVLHKEDISTEKVLKATIDKEIFILKNSIDSCKIIYDIFEN